MSALSDFIKSMPRTYQASICALNGWFSLDPEPWQAKIDLTKLDMRHGDHCILGQLFDASESNFIDGYDLGVTRLGIRGQAENYAFSTVANTKLWVDYLTLWAADRNKNEKPVDIVYRESQAFEVLARTDRNMVIRPVNGTVEFLVPVDDVRYYAEELPVGLERSSHRHYVFNYDGCNKTLIAFNPDFNSVTIGLANTSNLGATLPLEVMEFIVLKMKNKES